MLIKQTRLTEEAKKSKVLLNILIAMIMAFMFIQVGMLVGAIVVHLVIAILLASGLIGQNKELFALVEHGFSFLFILLSVFCWVKFVEKRKIVSMGFYKEGWAKKYLAGIFIGISMMSIVVFILFMLGNVVVEPKPMQPVGMAALVNIPIIFIAWMIQGSTEEVVTRGWLMNVLGAKYNITVGLVGSALLFGVLHLMNPSVNYIALLNIVLVGIFFGLCVIYTNSLWLVCGIHGAWNFAQGNLFGFAVSGNKRGSGTLIDLALTGNTTITGGEFGPEAGLVCSAVLIAATLILLLLKKKGYFSKHA